MTTANDTRYQRLVDLGWNREKLASLRTLVIGAGALGNEVVKNLSLLGVGRITIVDSDVIEDSNLTRSILFRNSDVGREKALVAAERAVEIDANVQAIPIIERFQSALGAGAFYEFDVVFGCLDNVQARIDLNRSCMQTNRLYLDGGLNGIDGDVKVFGDGYEVCYDCLLSDSLRGDAWKRFACLKLRSGSDEPIGPTAPTISSIIAGLQVQIAVKHIHGYGIPWNHRVSVHGRLDDFTVARLRRNRECPTHEDYSVLESGSVEVLPEINQQSTCQELYSAVVRNLGEGAIVELGYDLVASAHCFRHGFHKVVLKRHGTLFAEEMACPECQRKGASPIDSLLTPASFSQIGGDEPFLEQPLAAIGLPPKAILSAYLYRHDHLAFRCYQLGG